MQRTLFFEKLSPNHLHTGKSEIAGTEDFINFQNREDLPDKRL
jgi:hypothetical protein